MAVAVRVAAKAVVTVAEDAAEAMAAVVMAPAAKGGEEKEAAARVAVAREVEAWVAAMVEVGRGMAEAVD